MVKRVLIGKFPDGGCGIRVSQPGYDVTTNPVDNEKLHFSSDWLATLPVYVTGTIAVNATTATVNYADLGYIPFSSALINVNAGGWQQYNLSNSFIYPTRTVGTTAMVCSQQGVYSYSGNVYPIVKMNVFSNRVVFTTSTNVQFKYYIYKVKAF